MTARSSIWRAITWIERFLPQPALVDVSGEEKLAARRRAAFVPLVILPAVTLPTLLRARAVGAGTWSAWRPMILDMLVIAAGAVLVAGVAFGVHAWRQGKRHA